MFFNTLFPQSEEFLLTFIEFLLASKNDPIQIDRRNIGYAMCDIANKPIQRYIIEN